jgi:diguanylate cyclase
MVSILDRQKQALLDDLSAALAGDQLFLVYQVQKSVTSGAVLGYEALLRWSHPVRGTVMPKEFIPLAEESGLIRPLTLWVLRQACRTASQWRQPYKIAINVSAEFIDAELFAAICETLQETALAPERLELEVTESTTLVGKTEQLHQLARIRALGVKVALDDFGTGHSTFAALQAFAFDRIKLDRHFISSIDSDAEAIELIRSLLALGRSMGVPMLVEGVERAEQLDILRREGCPEAQGMLLGPPVPVIPG